MPPLNYDANGGSVTKKNVKATRGVIFTALVTNVGAALRWFQVHDKATAPVATDVPKRFWPIPAGSATVPGTLSLSSVEDFDNGMAMTNGIGWAISSTPTVFTDAATAADHTVQVEYN